MARVCPQCSTVNVDGSTFCSRCGYRFQGNEQLVNEDATVRQPIPVSIPADVDPASTYTPGSQPAKETQPQPQTQAAASFDPSAIPTYAQQQSSPMPMRQGFDPSQQGQVFLPPQPQSMPQQPIQQPPQYYQPKPQQQIYGQTPYGYNNQAPAAPGALASLQRAYAGKGTPVHHQSWLLDGQSVQPAQLRSSLVEYVRKLDIPGVMAMPERLREQGVVMEERDYAKVHYGATSVYVYMAPMGRNLYISRTTTVQQPLSRARLISMAGLFVLMLICYLFYALVYPAGGDQGTFELVSRINTFFGLAATGLLLFFIFLALRSLVSLLTEQDFLAFFRPNRLNDFTLDIVSPVELITDNAIREVLKQAGINADDIHKPAESYHPQQPLRRF